MVISLRSVKPVWWTLVVVAEPLAVVVMTAVRHSSSPYVFAIVRHPLILRLASCFGVDWFLNLASAGIGGQPLPFPFYGKTYNGLYISTFAEMCCSRGSSLVCAHCDLLFGLPQTTTVCCRSQKVSLRGTVYSCLPHAVVH
jgi:hypothetical protein